MNAVIDSNQQDDRRGVLSKLPLNQRFIWLVFVGGISVCSSGIFFDRLTGIILGGGISLLGAICGMILSFRSST